MTDPKKDRLSDYSFCFRFIRGVEFLCIEDLNKGRMSVTNNIENIAAYLMEMRQPYHEHKPNKLKVKIIYCDSEGTWDGFNLVDMEFISLNQTGWLQAALKVIKYKL